VSGVLYLTVAYFAFQSSFTLMAASFLFLVPLTLGVLVAALQPRGTGVWPAIPFCKASWRT